MDQTPSKPDACPELPDTSTWQPHERSSETLSTAFLQRCIGIERLVQLRVELEKQMNLHNFDSGPGVEDIIRDEVGKLLPTRYAVRSGVINDRYGRSAQDCDLIIFNEVWFPVIKYGATEASRRFHFPVDGVYAVAEIKQSVGYDELDEAMKKLVICHRLHRPHTFAYRVTENREGSSCTHGLTNPLFSAIIATDLKDGVSMQDLVERFYDICRSLKRLEVVRALCVLGVGTVTWGFRDDGGEIWPARFMKEDLYQPIFPAYFRVPRAECALYHLMCDLFLHLYHSILAPEDVAPSYGPRIHNVSTPTSDSIALPPDREWLESLEHICVNDDFTREGGPTDPWDVVVNPIRRA